MKLKLLKNTNQQFLLLSEEEPISNQVVFSKVTNTVVNFTDPRHFSKGTYFKVLAAHPSIKDISELSLENIKKKLKEKEERRIEELAVKFHPKVTPVSSKGFDKEEARIEEQRFWARICFIGGYKLAQQENADKKYTEEDMKKAYESGDYLPLEKPMEWKCEVDQDTMENTIIINKILWRTQ